MGNAAVHAELRAFGQKGGGEYVEVGQGAGGSTPQWGLAADFFAQDELADGGAEGDLRDSIHNRWWLRVLLRRWLSNIGSRPEYAIDLRRIVK